MSESVNIYYGYIKVGVAVRKRELIIVKYTNKNVPDEKFYIDEFEQMLERSQYRPGVGLKRLTKESDSNGS